jgi:thiosulfate/3-mercaptopyruvate sulfurtransferase
MGKNEGIPGDVHFRQGRMNCVACHDGASMHNSEGNNHRYEGEQSPTCESCHDQVGKATDAIVQHQIHQDTLSCQVCHSVTYTSCDSCHVAVSETTGNPFFKTAATYSTFFIGRNPRQSVNRPYEYVPVRHIPVDPNNFDYYGENLLPNFNLLPNWAYATPHNIQRVTPQNESCNACHGNAEIFLTADKVKPEELEANRDVIVENIPVRVPEQQTEGNN